MDSEKNKYSENDEYSESNFRNSQISNDLISMKNKNGKKKKEEESFFDRIFIAFGCVSRDKSKKK
jgi:hypothetical protein